VGKGECTIQTITSELGVHVLHQNLEVDVENLLKNGAVSFHELLAWKSSLAFSKFFIDFFSHFQFFFLFLLFDDFFPFKSATS
jgi:hypothetical protein